MDVPQQYFPVYSWMCSIVTGELQTQNLMDCIGLLFFTSLFTFENKGMELILVKKKM